MSKMRIPHALPVHVIAFTAACAVVFPSHLPIAFAAESSKPACAPQDLTAKTCNYLRAHTDQHEFVLGDGRSFPNPLSPAPKPQANAPAQDPAKNEQMMTDMTEMYMSIAQTLRESSLKKLPPRSLQALTIERNIGAIVYQIETSKSPKTNFGYSPSALLPSPITGSLSPLKSYSPDELKAITDQLSESEKNTVMDKITYFRKKYPGPAMANAMKLMTATPESQKTERLTQRREENKEIFAEALKDMEAVIRNGSPDPLSGEKQAQIDKIKSIKLKNGNEPEVTLNPYCVGNAINAFYNPVDHTFAICDGAANLPKAQLMMIIGHELGHSIDSCSGPVPLYKINNEKLAQLEQKLAADSSLSSQNELGRTALIRLTSLAKPPRDLINLNLPHYIGPLSYNYLLKNGVLERQSSGVSLDRDPVNSVRTCLINQFGFQDVTAEDIEPKIKEAADAIKRAGGMWNSETDELLRSAYAGARRCEGNGTKTSELFEASADIYGAGVLARYLQRNPPKNDMEHAGMTALFNGPLCSTRYPSGNMPVDLPPVEILKQFSTMTSRILNEPHPQDKKRVESVVFRHPGVASALGCSSITPGCTDGMKSGVFAGVHAGTSPGKTAPANSSDGKR